MSTSSHQPLRWGFLGAARIAASYAKAIPGSDAGSVYAVASRDLARARAFANLHGIPRVYDDYDQLLADPSVNAIYIALPNALHAEWSCRAMRAGKHVLCEKPLATCASEAEAMREVSRQTGRFLAEAAMYRLHPVNTTAISLLKSGRIGHLISANANFFAPVGEEDPIRFSSALGGGALLDLGFYCVSFLRWAASAEPKKVVGIRALHNGGVDVVSAGALQWENGTLGTFTCAYRAPFACRYELVGDTGRIVADGGPLCAWPDGEFFVHVYSNSAEPEIIKLPPADSYRLAAEAFAAAVQGFARMPWSLEESIANLRVLDAVASEA